MSFDQEEARLISVNYGSSDTACQMLRNSLFAKDPNQHPDFMDSMYSQKDAGAFIATILDKCGYQVNLKKEEVVWQVTVSKLAS